ASSTSLEILPAAGPADDDYCSSSLMINGSSPAVNTCAAVAVSTLKEPRSRCIATVSSLPFVSGAAICAGVESLSGANSYGRESGSSADVSAYVDDEPNDESKLSSSSSSSSSSSVADDMSEPSGGRCDAESND